MIDSREKDNQMKHDLDEVYRDLEKANITVLPYRFRHLKSVSLAMKK